jgi:hypothetical protein
LSARCIGLLAAFAPLSVVLVAASLALGCAGDPAPSPTASSLSPEVVAVRPERDFDGVTFPVYYVLASCGTSEATRLTLAQEVLGTAREEGAAGDVWVRFIDRAQYARWRAAPFGTVAFHAGGQAPEVALPVRSAGERPSAWQADAYVEWVRAARRAADPTSGFFDEACVARLDAKPLGVPLSRVRAAVDKVESWL